MGMFDNLSDYSIKCPYCGRRLEVHIQTKDLDCQFETYHVWQKGERNPLKFGETRYKAPKGIDRVEAIAVCESPLCKAISKINQIVRRGYFSGIGRGFDIEYRVRNRKIMAPAKIIEKYPVDYKIEKRKFLQKVRNDIRWKKVLKLCHGDFGLAVLHYNQKMK